MRIVNRLLTLRVVVSIDAGPFSTAEATSLPLAQPASFGGVVDQPADLSYVFAALLVRDRDAALARPPRRRWAGTLPAGRTATHTSAKVAATASVYILTDSSRAGSSEVTLVVTDIDGHRAMLQTRGIATEPVIVIGDAGRKSRVIDPDGNAIWFVELT